MKADITLTVEPPRSARARQVSGLFDVSLDEKLTASWSHDLPIEQQDWQVGLIVGPSGAGKSVLANRLWPNMVRESLDWSDRAIIEHFPADMSIHDVTGLLTSVGFGSVPAWLRPYSTLSNGERFRADMARLIAESSDDDIVVVDEFTSVVDRQVARVASHSVQKAIRRSGRRFVAVTCHYDVIDWLQPDWVYDVGSQSFAWRSVQPRPGMRFEIYEASPRDWPVFARHHYLTSELSKAARCFTAWLDGDLCGFTSYLHFPHPKTRSIKIAHRIVVLPDYQGLGIASRMNDWTGEYLAARGYRYRVVSAHPAMIGMFMRSPRWRECGRAKGVATSKKSIMKAANLSSRRLAVRSFEYQPPAEGKSNGRQQ